MGKIADPSTDAHEKQPLCNERKSDKFRKSAIGFFRTITKAIVKAGKALIRFLFPIGVVKALAPSPRTLSFLTLILVTAALIMTNLGQSDETRPRIEAIERTVRAIQIRLAMPDAVPPDRTDPTTLLIAVQFITNAAERSTPFDTALAVAIKMTGNHPKLGLLLDELLIEAPSGVPSRDKLRADFRNQLERFAQDGIIDDVVNDAAESSFRIGGFLGFGGPEASEEERAIIQQLTANLAADNFASSVQLIGKLDGKLREDLESWRKNAKRRVAVDNILTELRRSAFLAIMEQDT